MLDKLKKLFYKYFDYNIVGEFLDDRGNGHYRKRYIKKYYLKSPKKRGVKR